MRWVIALKALGVGLLFGAIVRALGLPIPAPPTLAGVLGVVGDVAGWSGLQKIAVASVAAFLVSETVEFALFAPIRKRSLTTGVALSGIVGSALDSYVFLTLAFGSLAFFDGQMVGKAEALAVGVALTAARRAKFPVAVTE